MRKKTVTLRLPEPGYRKLERVAKEQGVSIETYVLRLLQDRLSLE